MFALILIIVGSIFNGIGVYINMKHSPRLGEFKISVDGGDLDTRDDPDRIPRRNRKDEDEKNEMGYIWVLAGVVLNLAAAVILFLDYINS